jgi:hypothetical protein
MGETRDLGVVGYLMRYRLDEVLTRAWVIKVQVPGGRTLSHRLAGVYHGFYLSVDPNGRKLKSVVSGFIDADGRGYLDLNGAPDKPSTLLSIAVRDSTRLDSLRVMGTHFTLRARGEDHFNAGDNGLHGSFAFTTNGYLDSLELYLEAIPLQKK